MAKKHINKASLHALHEAREEAKEKADQALAHLKQIDEAIYVMSQQILVVDPYANMRQDFAGLGPTEAARRFLLQAGEPIDTQTIARHLRARGVTTSMDNPDRYTAMLFATLRNGKADFERIGHGKQGRWKLTAAAEKRMNGGR